MRYRLTSSIASAALLSGALLTAPVQAQTYQPPAAKEGFSYPEVYCTNRGSRVELGELSCLRISGKSFVARCDMSLNNPIWRKVDDGCPAELAAAPVGDSGGATLSSRKPEDK